MRIEDEGAIYFRLFHSFKLVIKMSWKRIVALTVMLSLTSVLIAYGIAGAPHFGDEEARLAYVTKQTSFKIVNTWDVPQRFLGDAEQQSYITLPENITTTVLKYVGGGEIRLQIPPNPSKLVSQI